MGIPGLFAILGDGQVTAIAHLAADHYTKTGRPLRIAVDEAGWRFHNLTDAQVAAIRRKEPAANPIEKAILHRLLTLLRLPLQPLFIFDGPSRPHKRGSAAGRIDYSRTALLIQLLDQLRIPHHHAPAEAEAECARLQAVGVVDAVWSEDGDALMFGAGTLLRTSRGQKGEKSADLVRVHRADEIRDRVGWDRWAVMVFAVLSGGDYGKGLQGVGPVNAEKLVRWRGGRLGALMAEMRNDRYGRMMWREELLIALTELRCWVDVPPDFPRELIVRNYRDPKVSTPEQLVELRGLRGGWNKDVNELRLRAFLSERFNFWAKGYIRNVLPMLLARRLSRTQPGAESQNTVLDIQLVHKRRRGGQESPDQDQAKERTISFYPLALTALDLTFQPEEEDWTRLATKQGPFDPAARVEIELLECVLVNGMGTAWLSEQLSKIPEKASKSSKGKAAASGPPADGISTERENTRSQATTPAKGKRKAAEMGADVIATGELKRKRGSELSSPATPVSATPARQVSATPARPVFKLPSAYSAQNAIWQSENAPPTQSPQLPTPTHTNTTQGNGPRIPRASAQAFPPSETPTKQNDFPTHIRNARTAFLDRVDAGFMQSPVGAAKDTMPRSRPALPTPRLSLSGDGLAQLPPPASYEEAWRREYEERRTVARECIDLLGNDEGTPSGGKEGGKEKEVVVIDLTDD